MESLTAVATQHGLALLNSTLKNTATRYALIGATTHDSTTPGTFYTDDIETSYYDNNGVLTFVAELPIEQDFNRYLHSIAIIDNTDQIVVNTPTPKIALAGGIGGMVTIKAAVTGEPGEVVFKASDYVTVSELQDTWLIPATDSQSGLIRIATQAEITAGTATDVAINPTQISELLSERANANHQHVEYLKKNNLVILTGNCGENYTIPIPSGFVEADCYFMWFMKATDGTSYHANYDYTGTSRTTRVHTAASYNIHGSYIVIARK